MRDFLTCLLVCVLAACSDTPDWYGVAVDTLPDGRVIVTNEGEGDWSAEGAARQAVEELRIGRIDADDAFAIGNVVALEVDELGRIYALDRTVRQVKVFGPDGSHLRSLGGQGGGPGEFSAPFGLFWDTNGDLIVSDLLSDRLTTFDTTGTLVGTRPMDGKGTFRPRSTVFMDDGTVADITFRGLQVFAPDFVSSDTLPMPVFEGEAYSRRPGGGGGGGAVVLGPAQVPVPFSATQTYALDVDGNMWVGVTDRYELSRLALPGDTVQIVRRTGVMPHPVTSLDREGVAEDLERWTNSGFDIDTDRIPAHKPLFSEFFFADDGGLWVQLETESAFEGQRYDVFDPEGRYLGQVEAPEPLEEVVIRNGFIYGIAKDDLDVEYIVRLRVEEAP